MSSWERQGKFTGQHSQAQEAVVVETALLGCIWDGSGCANGCDTDSMMNRCQRLNHDQEACEGDEGQMIRYCVVIQFTFNLNRSHYTGYINSSTTH